MNCESMDELSRRFADNLFATFREWEQFAKTIHETATSAAAVEVEIPQEGTDRVLSLSTADQEITIAFDGWHTHVGPFLGLTTEEAVAEAIGIIAAFVAEETVVKVVYRNGEWKQSTLEYLAAPSDPEPQSTTNIYSWMRTHDQVLAT